MAATPAPKLRRAPPDPTLPKPWRGLIDSSTGYLYFWNTETNVTQYQRPAPATPPSPTPQRPPSPDPQRPPSPAPRRPLSPTHQRAPSPTPQRAQSPTQQGPRSPAPQRALSPTPWRQPSPRRPTGSRDDEITGDESRNQQGSMNAQYSFGSRVQSDDEGGGNGSQPHQSRDNVHGSSHQPNAVSKVGHELSGMQDRGQMTVSRESGEAYQKQHEITVVGGDNVPLPYTTFASTGFPSEILREVQRAGFSAPTPIQAQSWPIVLGGRDIVAVAKTGSGKTLGYLIPGFIHLKRLGNNPKAGPTVLVLSPTRELATQIQDEAEKFGSSSRISSTCLYGGAPKGPQIRDVERGVDVVVATPGRLNDILEMRKVSLHQVSYLVLDEADRMLDMGFEPQIRKVVKELPTCRQTLMFTATWPKAVRTIAADLLNNPIQVNIGNVDELVANKSITQYVEVITSMEKQRRLEQILRSHEPGSKIIIFCSTKRMCDQLSRNLGRYGAAAIHGDKSQSERDSVLSQFRSGRSPILVATDVAARGLDVKDIRVVINYDFPTGVEDYVHRIGRTGRGGATGTSYTFFCDQDSKYAADLVKILEGADQQVPQELLDMVSRGGYGGRSRRFGSGSDGGGRGNRDGPGRFNGGGQGDSNNCGTGGWGVSQSSGWSANFTGGPCDSSYDRSRSRSPGPNRYAGTGQTWG